MTATALLYSLLLLKLIHQLVLLDLGCKVAGDALLPVRDLEGGGVAPGLEGELLLNDGDEAAGPAESGELVDDPGDEVRVEEVGAAASEKREV